MLIRGGVRSYLYISTVVALLLLIITAPRTQIPQRAGWYVKSILGHQEEKPLFNPDKWHFQVDLDQIEPIEFDFERLKELPPRNYKGPGHETYATLFSSRDATLQDPYFDATMQIIYRLLWSPKMKTKKHPVTVFVTQHVNQTHRDYFTAAGAIVRELALHPFEPTMKGVPARLQDMFSKLEMWKQLDFTRIAYLDGDAFPWQNIDSIFSQAPEQVCKYDMVPGADMVFGKDICNYVFSAVSEAEGGQGGINAGVMMFKPDQAMYTRLIRESGNKDGWDTGYLEQALLSHAYDRTGPFPPHDLDPSYNAFPDYPKKGIEIKILHDKLWAHLFDDADDLRAEWKNSWEELVTFFKSEKFYESREADGQALQSAVKNLSQGGGRIW